MVCWIVSKMRPLLWARASTSPIHGTSPSHQSGRFRLGVCPLSSRAICTSGTQSQPFGIGRSGLLIDRPQSPGISSALRFAYRGGGGSVPIRFNNSDAGSSVGSWSTSLPRTARLRMVWRRGLIWSGRVVRAGSVARVKRALAGKESSFCPVSDGKPVSTFPDTAWSVAEPDGKPVPTFPGSAPGASASGPVSEAVRRARLAAVSRSRVASRAVRAASSRSSSAISSSTFATIRRCSARGGRGKG